MVREAATFPLIVRVLFIACVAMLAGNALVLILNLETTASSESNVDHERSRTDTKLIANGVRAINSPRVPTRRV